MNFIFLLTAPFMMILDEIFHKAQLCNRDFILYTSSEKNDILNEKC